MPYEILKVNYRDSGCNNKDELRKILKSQIEVMIKEGWYCSGDILTYEFNGVLYAMYQLMLKE
jgi:hypothetical protein